MGIKYKFFFKHQIRIKNCKRRSIIFYLKFCFYNVMSFIDFGIILWSASGRQRRQASHCMINYIPSLNLRMAIPRKMGHFRHSTSLVKALRVWMVLSGVVGRVVVLTINKTFREAQHSNIKLNRLYSTRNAYIMEVYSSAHSTYSLKQAIYHFQIRDYRSSNIPRILCLRDCKVYIIW